MGYTHYFPRGRNFTADEWRKISDAVSKVVTHWRCPPIAEEYDYGCHPAVVNRREIRFNGLGKNGHETFSLDRVKAKQETVRATKYPYGFNFCKTARKPYDAVVVAVLIIADHFAPGALQISSDGYRENWYDGLALAVAATGIRDLAVPAAIAGRHENCSESDPCGPECACACEVCVRKRSKLGVGVSQ